MKSDKAKNAALRKAALCAFVVSLCAGCFSGPVTIPEGSTVAEIIQMGQDANDKGRYGQAIQYYQAIKTRFPTDTEAVVGADYEIAYIHYKQSKYSMAKAEFTSILAVYDTPQGENLSRKYQILSNIVLKRIADKQKIGG